MATKKTNKVEEQSSIATVSQQGVAVSEVGRDLKNSVFVLSVFANLVLFTTWLVTLLAPQYNQALSSFLFK